MDLLQSIKNIQKLDMKWRVIVCTTILLLLVKRCNSATSTTTATTTTSPAVVTTVQQIPAENKDLLASTKPPSNNEIESNPVITTQPPQKPSETTTTEAPVVTEQAVDTSKLQQEPGTENSIKSTTTAVAGNQNPDQTLVTTTKASGSDETNLDNTIPVSSAQANTTSSPEKLITATTTLAVVEGTSPVANDITAANGQSNQEPVVVNDTADADNVTTAGDAKIIEQIAVNDTTPGPIMAPTSPEEIKSAPLNNITAADGTGQSIENTTVESSVDDAASKNESSLDTNVQITTDVQITTTPTELNTSPLQTDQTTLYDISTTTELVTDLDELEFNIDGTTPDLDLIEPTTYNFTNEEETAEEIIDELIEDIFGIETNLTTGPPTNVSQDLSSNTTESSFFTDGSTYSVILITSLCFGIVFFLVVIILVTRRVYDGWQKRHYSRIDYLVNGMYN